MDKKLATCVFHAHTFPNDGFCPECFPSKAKANRPLNTPQWNVARGRTVMLSELHAMKLIEGLHDKLASMTPFDIATMGILQGIIVAMDIIATERPSSVTRESVDQAIDILNRKRT